MERTKEERTKEIEELKSFNDLTLIRNLTKEEKQRVKELNEVVFK